MTLCESCANGRGIMAGNGGLELNIDDLIGVGLDAVHDPARPEKCPGCGLELSTLRREGRLGCSDCANVFFDEIHGLLGRQVGFDPGSDVHGLSMPIPESLPCQDIEASRLNERLAAALQAEDYEGAASLRDELSRRGEGSGGRPPPPSNHGFPFDPQSFALTSGPDDDVVLSTSARVYRDIAGLPFPGSPHGPPAPSRSALLERFLSYGSWLAFSVAELGSVGRRSLSERGILPRGYAADDTAVIISDTASRTYALLDEGDHLRLRTMAPGLDAAAALAPALAIADRLGGDFPFAHRPGIGWICARLDDCGLGCSLSSTIHIPALAAVGMKDRLFRSLLSEGIAIRGFYSSGEESTGSIYEIGIESASADSPQALASRFSAAVTNAVAAERRARSEISARRHAALIDAEGRAFGITRYFGLTGVEEAASLISVLRLAALRGSLPGANPRVLGLSLLALGPGSVAQAAGLKEMPAVASQDALRARLVKNALAGAEYRVEEGA